MTESDADPFRHPTNAHFTHSQMADLYNNRPPLTMPSAFHQHPQGVTDQLHLSPAFLPREHFDHHTLLSHHPEGIPLSNPFVPPREEDTAAHFISVQTNSSPTYPQTTTHDYLTHLQQPQVVYVHNQPISDSYPKTDERAVITPDEKLASENENRDVSNHYNVERITENPASPPPEADTVQPSTAVDEINLVGDNKEMNCELSSAGADGNGSSESLAEVAKRGLVSDLLPDTHEETTNEALPDKTFSAEEKLRIVHQAKVYGLDKAAEKFDVPRNIISLWKKTVPLTKLKRRGRPRGKTIIMDRAIQVTFSGEKTLADILAEETCDAEAEPNVADSIEVFPNDCALKIQRLRARRRQKPLTYNADDYFASQIEDQGNILADFAEIVASESFMTGQEGDEYRDEYGVEPNDVDDDDDVNYPIRRRSRVKKKFSAQDKKNILDYAQSNSLRTTSKKFKVPLSKIIKWKEAAKNNEELVGDEGADESQPRSKKRRGNVPNVPRGPYKKYSLDVKKSVVEFTHKHSLRKAAEYYKMPVSTVMAWKRELEKPNIKRNKDTGRKIGSGRVISYSAKVDQEIVNWINAKKEAKIHVGIRDICQYAQSMVCSENPESKFKASHGWVTKFIKRHQIQLDRCRKRRPHAQDECGKANGSTGAPKKPRNVKRSQPVPAATVPIPDMRRDMPTMNHDRGPSAERHQTPTTMQYTQYGDVHAQVPIFSHNYMYSLPPASVNHAAHVAPPADALHNHVQATNLQYNSWIPTPQSNTLTYSTHTAPNQATVQTYWPDFPRNDYNPQQ